MTSKLVKKYLPPVVATKEGHLKQEWQGLQSSKTKLKLLHPPIKQPTQQPNHDDIINDFFLSADNITIENTIKNNTQTSSKKENFPESLDPNIKTNKVVYFLLSADQLGLSYLDLTGKYPVQSSRGNNYILIGYHQDANAILVTAIKNRQAQSIVDGWTILSNKFKKRGMKPKTWVMDNECSINLKSLLVKKR